MLGEAGERWGQDILGTMNCYKYNYQVPDIIPTGGGQARHVVVMADPTRTDLWWGEQICGGVNRNWRGRKPKITGIICRGPYQLLPPPQKRSGFSFSSDTKHNPKKHTFTLLHIECFNTCHSDICVML